MANTNKSKANKTRTPKQTAVSAERPVKANTIKLGIDVHLDCYVVVRAEWDKWTFFTVTYDGSRSQENVSWYFSPPLDAPGKTEVMLDRKTSYTNGAVGTDLRGLAIGNFNETMQGSGMDRQFRGENRGLQLFGSRVGGGGALSLEQLSTRQ
jgi:hypothetical protein